MKPVAVDLFCGLGGWAEGLMSAGMEVVGFDNERHVYGDHRYPAQLVIQDVRTLDGSRFRDVALIVASPPCVEYSYMAMPWKRGKQIARALRGEDTFPDGYKGSRTIAKLNELFDSCFRIQREASEAAGHHIPMVVENVRGAIPWVGRPQGKFGSYYLWGDVPALMPISMRRHKVGSLGWSEYAKTGEKSKGFNTTADQIVHGRKNSGGSWFNIGSPGQKVVGQKVVGQNPDGRLVNKRNGNGHTRHLTNPAEHAIKVGGDWFSDPNSPSRTSSSKSTKRKFASAMIAKIPFPLALHIGEVYGSDLVAVSEKRGTRW